MNLKDELVAKIKEKRAEEVNEGTSIETPEDQGGRGLNEGDRPGAGPGGVCVCPQCGKEFNHDTDIPCNEATCPQCDINLTRASVISKEDDEFGIFIFDTEEASQEEASDEVEAEDKTAIEDVYTAIKEEKGTARNLDKIKERENQEFDEEDIVIEDIDDLENMFMSR